MNELGIIFLLGNALAILMVPRRWAPLPFLIGACYITLAQKLVIGPFNFSVIRLLISVGWIRVLTRGELQLGKLTNLDRVLLLWGAWSLCSSFLHTDPSAILVNHLGLVYNAVGFYFLIRAFCTTEEDVVFLIQLLSFLLAPLAVEMVLEQLTGHNSFALFGAVSDTVIERGGRFRAQGPFAHAILAGSIAAGCVPLVLGLWWQRPLAAKIGLASALLMILASASSGPIMSALLGVMALTLWRWRQLTGKLRLAAVAIYIMLDLVMKRPAYFIIASIDLTGSSTGWHRAALMRSYFTYASEWMAGGSDYTRHWMASGILADANHVDITNQFIIQGVQGGLLLMILFILALTLAFYYVGRLARTEAEDQRWIAWTLGACLFAHTASFMSVAYFDQSFVFFYLPLAAVSSLYARSLVKSNAPRDLEEFDSEEGAEAEEETLTEY